MNDRLQNMTLEEKIALCSGADSWHTKDMIKHGLPSIMMTDGPHGLRKQTNATDIFGVNESEPATSFPTAVTSACSWDVELLAQVGEALGREAIANDVSIVLGPGANIKRNPLCGRNFEYFSEDPYLAGKLAAAYIKSMEATGVSSSLKHFACNSQEYKRFTSDSIIDERTLREIYLAAFEMAVKEARPSTIMCAYNKINGEYCSDNKWLLTEVLRREWGFDGLVVSDWGAMSDRIKAFQAGCDLCMPGGSGYMEQEAAQAVESGVLKEKDIDASAERVCRLVERGLSVLKKKPAVDMEQHNELAYRVAVESAVLLQNEENLLPLNESDSVAFIGYMAKEMRYQGSGSSHINPWKLTNVLEAYPQALFVEGCDADGNTTKELLEEAAAVAEKVKSAVLFVGLPDKYESEGFDRENMAMPLGHNQLIEAVAAANPNTIVVLMCGSPVEMPWADRVKAILYMGLPGQCGGKAIADLLFGRAVPCGKLAESWPYAYEDCICESYYANGKKDAHYREGLYVGYRYYTSARKKVRYPFGYGLSYTQFVYSDVRIDGRKVSCKIKNCGNRAGKEIVQLYIEPPKGEDYRPVLELKAFDKVYLAPNEEKKIVFELNDRSFAIWKNGWFIPAGKYHIWIGGSCDNLLLSGIIEQNELRISMTNCIEQTKEVSVPAWYTTLEGVPTHQDFEKLLGHSVIERRPQKGSFTMQNSLAEMREYSLAMKLMYKIVGMVVAGGIKGKKDNSNPVYRMMMGSALENTLYGVKISAPMKNYLLEGAVEIANGHFLRGIRLIIKRK